jgi:phospholipase C
MWRAGALLVLAAALAPGRPVAAAPVWTRISPVAPASKQHHKGLQNLQHLIFIVQENRAFDHYFGTFPGADGFPNPLPCLPSTWYPSQCFTPYLNHADVNHGGQHLHQFQVAMIDGGAMDGFITTREAELQAKGCTPPNGRRAPFAAPRRPDPTWDEDDEGIDKSDKCLVDVMGYHDGTDIPNYWAYAQNFVLQDHYYEAIESWSLPSHFMIASGWAAQCSPFYPLDVNSCSSTWTGKIWGPNNPVPNLWTDITYLLYQNGITWNAYVDGGIAQAHSRVATPATWDPFPGFQTVQDDGQVANGEVNLQQQFFSDAANGTLPQVSWIFPKLPDSEHPTAKVSEGQTYVTSLINALMSSPDWSSSAIFVSWDDSDGFYDHEPPPYIDAQGLGIRVPAFMISPFAIAGSIDHQICSSDCYLKFIEDVFLSGERISQAGRPDPRPDYRDEIPGEGDLSNDFDFNQKPRPPLLLPLHPMSLLRPGDPTPQIPHRIAPGGANNSTYRPGEARQ